VSSQVQIQSFDQLNSLFERKLSDSSLYRGKRFSFLKVFQHALTYEQAGADYRILKNYLHLPFSLHKVLLWLKAFQAKNRNTIGLREIVFIDPARIVRDDAGGWHSVYMERAIRLFNRQDVSVLSRKNEPYLPCEATLDKLPREYSFPDKPELEMLREISLVAKNVLRSSNWSDIQKKHILSAIHVFYDDFRFYYNLFKEQPVKTVVFISHYHNEGLIAALNVLNIRSVELQHGLISGNDLYYQYASAFSHGVKNAFFPDAICVYGSYWKTQLLKGCEFESTQITVAGDYQWSADQSASIVLPFKQVLICAQKNMHEEYVAYAQRLKLLMNKHPDWKWVIKMHPLEKNKDQYFDLVKDGFEIIDREKSLTALLKESSIQISIYSTTFFDALGFSIENYSLQDYSVYSDYAAEMVSEGVAEPLSVDEDPIEKHLLSKGRKVLRPRSEVYGQFDEFAMRNAILGG
jgi:hypothetical protein